MWSILDLRCYNNKIIKFTIRDSNMFKYHLHLIKKKKKKYKRISVGIFQNNYNYSCMEKTSTMRRNIIKYVSLVKSNVKFNYD